MSRPSKRDRAARRLEQARHQPRGRRLAAARLADEARASRRCSTSKRDAVDGLHGADLALEDDPARIGKCLTRSRTSTSGSLMRRSRLRSAASGTPRPWPSRASRRPAASAHSCRRVVGGQQAARRWWPGRPATGSSGGSIVLVRLAHVRAARVERAARRLVDQRRRPARDRHELLVARRVEARDRLQQAPRVRVLGRGEDRRPCGACSTIRPAYMTAISSATSATTPRSCVIITIAVSSSVCSRSMQLEDLRLDRHVERGRRLVGDQQLGVVDQRHRDHHALAHAARELVRVGVDAPARLGDADEPEHLDRAVARLRPCDTSLVGADGLDELVADPVERVQRATAGPGRSSRSRRRASGAAPRRDALQQVLAVEAGSRR